MNTTPGVPVKTGKARPKPGSGIGSSAVSASEAGVSSLAVIVVSFNTRELLRDCLAATFASLERSPEVAATVWVVDNASCDGSAQMVAAEFPRARLIESKKNLGFTAANNLVLKRLGTGVLDGDDAGPPDFVLLLNPDAEPQANAIGQMVRFLAQQPEAGGVGAQLRYPDGRFQHGAFRFPDLKQLWFDLFPPRPARLLETRLNGRYPRRLYKAGQPFPVDFVLGAALMVRRAAIEHAGLLDEGYFMYAEEVDWCWRMQRAGWPFYCVPTAIVVHHGGASARQFKSQSFLNLWRSRRRLYRRFYGPIRRRLAAAIVRHGMQAEEERVRQAHRRGEIDAEELAYRITAIHRVAGLFACWKDGPQPVEGPCNPNADK